MTNKKIAIIGCGNLGKSILNGFLKTDGITPQNLIVTRRNISQLEDYQATGIQITSDNAKAIAFADVVIVALKPYRILDVLSSHKAAFASQDKLLISLATAISLNDLEHSIEQKIPIFRAMPNTASSVSNSLTCICGNTDNQEHISLVKTCFDTIGKSVMIPESLMDSATVLGACGIAYVLRFIRAMVQGGIQIGFDSETANTIVTQTVKGAAELLIQGKQHPEYEIDKVTTPKGCTIAGLNEMEHHGFSSSLIKGIIKSFDAIDR